MTEPLTLGQRADQLARLANESFDVVVVGGGITGAGVALDLASRGLRVALLEQFDFASGTSSRSSKLIHGGLRYLAQGQIHVTRVAVQERERLLRLAPHLVERLPFLIPVYGGWSERLWLGLGLTVYDLLAGLERSRWHRWWDRETVLRRVPSLRAVGLDSAYVYEDCRTDDARLVLTVLGEAVARGAAVANYTLAMAPLFDHRGVAGVVAGDRLSGREFTIRAPAVVLAGGVWAARLFAWDPLLPPLRLRPSKGVHLVLPGERLAPADLALYVPTGRDRRLVFVIPWYGRTLVGTTDTPYEGDLAAPRCTADDLEYLLGALHYAFPTVSVEPADVLSVQAGLRPLIDTGARETTALSREDRVVASPTGIVAVAGGKLTAYREMAEKVGDLVGRRLAALGRAVPPSPTRTLPLGGRWAGPDAVARLVLDLAGTLPPSVAWHLVRRYGETARLLADLIAADPRLGEPLVPGLPWVGAEVVYAARHEQAMTVADVLARRTRLALLLPDQGRCLAPKVAAALAEAWGRPAEAAARLATAYEQDALAFTPPGRA